MPKLMFFYGTLKKGHYNHTRFNPDGIGEFQGKASVPGFSLVQESNVPFPFAIPDEKGKVEGEVYEVEDDLADRLHRMELRAGYKEVKIPIWGFSEEVSMYVCDCPIPDNLVRFSYFPIPSEKNHV